MTDEGVVRLRAELKKAIDKVKGELGAWKACACGWRTLYDELYHSEKRPPGSYVLPMKDWIEDNKEEK